MSKFGLLQPGTEQGLTGLHICTNLHDIEHNIKVEADINILCEMSYKPKERYKNFFFLICKKCLCRLWYLVW